MCKIFTEVLFMLIPKSLRCDGYVNEVQIGHR